MARYAALAVSLACLGLTGCGASLTGGAETGLISDRLVEVGRNGPAGRARPYASLYRGELEQWSTGNTLEFRLDRAGPAGGTIQPAGGTPIQLIGRFTESCTLQLNGGGFAIHGEFTGATHPQDAAYRTNFGVRFVGTWTRGADQGPVRAWYYRWPPRLNRPIYTPPYDDDDDDDDIIIIDDDGDDDDGIGDGWSDDDDWSGGGGSGGGGSTDDDDGDSTGGSSGGGSTGGGSSGGDDGGSTGGGSSGGDDGGSGGDDGVIDGGGGGTGDDVIFRRPRR